MPDILPIEDPWETPFHYCRFSEVDEHLPRMRELGIGIEPMLDDSRILWPDIKWEEVLGTVDQLADVGVPAQLHGPFHNLSLGARDEHIRHYSRELMFRGFQVARALGSPIMVIHSGFLPQYSPETVEAWWRSFSEELPKVLTAAQGSGVTLLMENTYETDPTFFERVFEQFNRSELGMCLDVGHAHCHGRVPVGEWVARLRSQIQHLHISDNDGVSDRHWTLGEGTVELSPVLEMFARDPERPTVTLEVPFDSLNESLTSYRQICRSIMKGLATQ